MITSANTGRLSTDRSVYQRWRGNTATRLESHSRPLTGHLISPASRAKWTHSGWLTISIVPVFPTIDPFLTTVIRAPIHFSSTRQPIISAATRPRWPEPLRALLNLADSESRLNFRPNSSSPSFSRPLRRSSTRHCAAQNHQLCSTTATSRRLYQIACRFARPLTTCVNLILQGSELEFHSKYPSIIINL